MIEKLKARNLDITKELTRIQTEGQALQREFIKNEAKIELLEEQAKNVKSS